MLSTTPTYNRADLLFAWALAVLDSHDWLRVVANADADFGSEYSIMLALADRILLGESIHDAAAVRSATEAALCQIEWRWSDNVDDEDLRVLAGFRRRSAPVDELSQLWAESAACVAD